MLPMFADEMLELPFPRSLHDRRSAGSIRQADAAVGGHGEAGVPRHFPQESLGIGEAAGIPAPEHLVRWLGDGRAGGRGLG